MMKKISVAIITKNEAQNIGRAVISCTKFDEIIVLDSGSDDETLTIARAAGATCLQSPWDGFGKQKQRAVELCANDWILSLDADEQLSDGLINEIETTDFTDPSVAYRMKRINYFLGKRVRFSGWQNDYVIRVFNKNCCQIDDRLVHEKVVGYAALETFNHPCFHFTYAKRSEIEDKVDRYSRLAAAELLKKRTKPIAKPLYLLKASFAFTRTFILKLGILDGITGMQIAAMNYRYTYLKYKRFNLYLRNSTT
jgi:glycosyltransferase involved in cell wall biosynthesis